MGMCATWSHDVSGTFNSPMLSSGWVQRKEHSFALEKWEAYRSHPFAAR